MISDDVKDDKEQKTKALLPPKQKKEGRCYVAKAKEMRADYWVHFLEYTENGKRYAECMYCENQLPYIYICVCVCVCVCAHASLGYLVTEGALAFTWESHNKSFLGCLMFLASRAYKN